LFVLCLNKISENDFLVEQLKTMKKTNEKLKVFYSILGQWKPKHLDLIRDSQQRTKFNQQIKQYLIDNNLDGFGSLKKNQFFIRF
jgi:hypothetical protein